MSDFRTQEEGLAAADSLIKMNIEDYNHPGGSRPNENPLLVRFWYVVSGGTSHKYSTGEREALSKCNDDSKAIEKNFSGPALEDATEVAVKIENPEWEPFHKGVAEVKGKLGPMKLALNRTNTLALSFLVRGRGDGAIKAHHAQLEKMIGAYEAFLKDFELKLAEISCLTAASEGETLKSALADARRMAEIGEAHKDGHGDVVKRYGNILSGKVVMDPTTLVKSLSLTLTEGM